LYALYANDGSDLLLETIEDKRRDLANIHQQLLREQERNTTTDRLRETLTKIESLADIWDYMTVKENQDIVRRCIDKVEVKNNGVSIHFKVL